MFILHKIVRVPLRSLGLEFTEQHAVPTGAVARSTISSAVAHLRRQEGSVTCSSPLMVRLNEKEFTEPRRLIAAVQQASSAVQLVPHSTPLSAFDTSLPCVPAHTSHIRPLESGVATVCYRQFIQRHPPGYCARCAGSRVGQGEEGGTPVRHVPPGRERPPAGRGRGRRAPPRQGG